MRILLPACMGLAVISCVTSAVLWNELRSDRQLIEELRTELSEAKTALATRPALATMPVVVAATATPAEAGAQPIVAGPVASNLPVAAPAKITREEAISVLTADSVKRQKALMADPEYRKALLAQAKSDLQQRYASLGMELGMNDVEVNALFDVLAEGQVQMMTLMNSLANGAQPDAVVSAESQRQIAEQTQKLKDQVTTMLGHQRYTQFEEYDRIQPSRTRVNNLANLLGRSGQALSNPQRRQLTAVMVTEQNRMEAEAKALRDAGKTDTRSPADIQSETNLRILEQVPSFLSAQQVQLVRGRFQERATIDRASDRVQQREREVLQEEPN